MPMNFDTRFLLAKVQAAQGVAADYSGADLVPAIELTLNPLQGDLDERDVIRGVSSAPSRTLARPRVQVTGSVEAAGAGVGGAGSPGFHDALLRAAGLKALADPVGPPPHVAYFPTAPGDPVERLTVVAGFGGEQAAPGRADDFLQEVVDCVGTIGFTAAEGESARFTFDLLGAYSQPVARSAIVAASPLDIGALSAPGFRFAPVVSFADTIFTFSGQALRLRNLTISEETQLIPANRPNDFTARRARRIVSGQMTVTAPAIADFDMFARSLDRSEHALRLTHGPAGNQVRVVADFVQARLASLQDDQGEVTATFDLTFQRPGPSQAQADIQFWVA